VALILAVGVSVTLVVSITHGGPLDRQLATAGGGAVIGMLAAYLSNRGRDDRL
jgi:hypothetical protein